MSIERKLIGTVDATAFSGPAVYVEDVFSTYLYTGTGAAQKINNGIALGNSAALGTIIQINGDAITDISVIPSTFTNVGPVTVNTSIKKYGTGSLFFNGSSKLITSSNSNIPIAAGEDFTIEAWIYPTTVTSNATVYTFATPRSNSGNWVLGIYFGKLIYYDESVGTFYGNATITANTWQHVAFSRSGTTFRLFLNGVLTDTKTGTAQAHASTQIAIGSDDSGTNNIVSPYYGYIDDFRVCRGVALYTSNFTPPSAALPVDTLVAGKGGMVWIKCRQADGHKLFDTVRGAQNRISSSSTVAQASDTALTSFTSTGYVDQANWFTSNTVASWTFRKQPKFFDVVTFTSDASGGASFSHALSVTPGMVIIKSTSAAGGWVVWHKSLATNYALILSSTNAAYNNGAPIFSTLNSTSAVISNGSLIPSSTQVAYLFADSNSGGFGPAGTDSVVACGGYSGTGAAGNAVSLGWEPQFVLIKATNGTFDWNIQDVMRGMSNTDNAYLRPNLIDAEANIGNGLVVPTATGFTLAGGSNGWNGSGYNYIYLAIRRGPMKTPTDATKVFTVNTRSGTGASATVTSAGFPVDMLLPEFRSGSVASRSVYDRLRGRLQLLNTSVASAEVNDTNGLVGFDSMTGYLLGADNNQGSCNYSSTSYVDLAFRRAPGFFDVVCYTGTGSARTVAHNLGVAPEMIIVKDRNNNNGWFVYNQTIGNDKSMSVHNTSAAFTIAYWSNTSPTATVFSLNNFNNINTNTTTYVAYLFATCPGVSKVFSFTGNGSSQTIDCGFTSGARFVLIKRTDSTGDWWVYDSARGIVSAADPALQLNSTAAEVTSADAIDPASSGFIVNQEATCNVNVNNATYIGLAIA